MDKYEFNIKVEQIRKLVSKADYETAMKIADTIDWKKVRNTNLLSMVSQVYEKNEEYQDAKDILLLAFERAPIGKRLLYKLTELALKEENMEEAEAYYREFCDLSGDDPRQYLLRYMILKQKNAPLEQLIHSLESYTSEELDEKWLYELAELYHEAGDATHCVSTCDKIMLMFGLGKYVDKAMELKLEYAPLTKYQMDLVENREKYEEKLRAVEQSFQDVADDGEEYAEEPQAPQKQQALYADDNIRAEVSQAQVEEELKKEISRISVEEPQGEAKDDLGKTRILSEISRKAPVATQKDMDVSEPVIAQKPASVSEPTQGQDASASGEAIAQNPSAPLEAAKKPLLNLRNHLMIEARTPDKGLELALETLRKLQKESGVKNPVAKITGSKLNKKGILANADKLEGKDLMIEEAGDLSSETIRELEQFMAQDTVGVRVILIDNPRQMEMLHSKNPSLASGFQCIASGDAFKSAGGREIPEPAVLAESAQKAEVSDDTETEPETIKEPEIDNRPVRRVIPVRDGAMRAPDKRELLQEPVNEERELEDDEEMNIDDFAQYACDYAAEIDCSITGKSMLALYERIEIMEEDGIPLTRSSAEDLIEEAADRAEKPSLGKAIKGIFSSKYDKEGRLILKEEHFI